MVTYKVFGFQFQTLMSAKAYMGACIAVSRASLTPAEKTSIVVAIAAAMHGRKVL